MKPLECLTGLVIACASIAYAHDWKEREGLFLAGNDSEILCYADTKDGCVREFKPTRNRCKGDAIGNREQVFKVPNRTTWLCKQADNCIAYDSISSAIMVVAKVRNGADKYDLMSFKHFMQIMGDKKLCGSD